VKAVSVDVVQGCRRRKDRYSVAQLRVLRALAVAEKPCTADDLTEKGLIGPTVLTLGCLMRQQLVSSQVVRRSDAERPIPVYVLTGKGKDVIAQLDRRPVSPIIATHSPGVGSA